MVNTLEKNRRYWDVLKISRCIQGYDTLETLENSLAFTYEDALNIKFLSLGSFEVERMFNIYNNMLGQNQLSTTTDNIRKNFIIKANSIKRET